MAALNVADHPALARAIAAQLRVEAPKPAPYDPDHDPFGHVRLSSNGGGWHCGVVGCGRSVVRTSLDTWAHGGPK